MISHHYEMNRFLLNAVGVEPMVVVPQPRMSLNESLQQIFRHLLSFSGRRRKRQNRESMGHTYNALSLA